MLPKNIAIPVIFLPARPASQTHDSHKGRMIFNHESPAGRIKNCGEKSALSFWMFFFYLHTASWIILVKTGTEILPNSKAIITSLGTNSPTVATSLARGMKMNPKRMTTNGLAFESDILRNIKLSSTDQVCTI